ncbi:MAG TPA: dephospho-CoA kinase [Bacteroidales bacterium]|nr:dephospho-CoA kinase [Bacteroidales bacterium]
MLKVGITGNIGCGKSTVAKIFQTLGVPVFAADMEAHLVMLEPHIIGTILKTFGTEVIGGDGLIDRKKMAQIVFGDEEKLEKLNAIIHPAVRLAFSDWCKANESHPFVIEEAAILFETGMAKDFDLIIVVSAPEEVRLERVIKRDGISRDEFYKRAAVQWPESKKTELADFIIHNDGQQLLISQVTEIWQKITGKAN